MSLSFVDVNRIRDAIADVRSDRTATNWILVSYTGENTNDVELVGHGEGGAQELLSHLKDNAVGYGLLRLVEKFDESDTVKFVFIRWIGENIHRMLRARLGTHSGAIKELLSPYHVSVEAETKDEVTEDIIIATVKKAAGTAVHVLEKVVTSTGTTYTPAHTSSPKAPTSLSGSSFAGGVPKGNSSLTFVNERELRAAIQDVRNDATTTNWVIATYDGPNSNNVVLAASGSGGSSELLEHLKEDNVIYGLIRQTEKFDDSQRAMFAFINWTGESIHRMLRARLSTHSGAIKEIFAPYHVSINAANDSEISPHIITTTIRETMGTASKVRD